MVSTRSWISLLLQLLWTSWNVKDENEVQESYCCAFVLFRARRGMGNSLPMKSGRKWWLWWPYVAHQTNQQRYLKEILIYSSSTTRSCSALHGIHILGQRIVQHIFQIQKGRVSPLHGCHAYNGKIYSLWKKRPQLILSSWNLIEGSDEETCFPSAFVDLVLIFSIPSDRICDIFHSVINYLCLRYVQKLWHLGP